MSSKKISELSAMTSIVGDEPIPAVQGGETLSFTPNLLLTFINAQPTMLFKGQADASAVDEQAATGETVFNNGDVYRINVANAAPHAFSDIAEDLDIGDWVVYNGTIWQKQDGSDPDAAQTKTLYESNLDTNAFTDAEKTNLSNQSGTNTGDETAGTIKTKYESNADTNAFTDAEQTKLAGIEAGATDGAGVLANNEFLQWRNTANTADLSVMALVGGDNFELYSGGGMGLRLSNSNNSVDLDPTGDHGEVRIGPTSGVGNVDLKIGRGNSIDWRNSANTNWINCLELRNDYETFEVGKGILGAIQIVDGSTGNRPATPTNGMIRYNTTTQKFEGREGGAWVDFIQSTTESLLVAVSDETTDLTTGTAKLTFRMPYAFTITEVRASVTTAPTGSALQVDINEGGVSILSTPITIDATEKTSTTAATPPVISDSSLADDAEITIDIDAIGSTVAGAGLKITLIGIKA